MITARRCSRESALSKSFYAAYDECEFTSELCTNHNCRCGRQIRRDWLKKQILQHFEPGHYWSLTICLPKDQTELYDLLDFDIVKSSRHITKRLRKLQISGFRGAFFLDVCQLDVITQARNGGV